MGNSADRRQHGRVGLSEHLRGFLGVASEIRVLNLSPAGAMVEHTEWLVVGQPCVFDLRLSAGDLRLRAYVVWRHLHTTLPGRSEEETFQFRSGLRFADLAMDAAAHLREYLATLSPPRAASPLGLG